MNRLKSIYIAIYPMLAMALGGYSIYIQSSSGISLAWFGVILATLPMLGIITWLLAFQNIARTSKHFPLITLIGVVGATLSTYEWMSDETLLLPAELSVLGLVTFLIYNFWYSSLGRTTNSKLAIGNSIPNFSVKNKDGQHVTSASFLGNPVIFIFYRGNWCPLCMAQIKEIVAEYKSLSEYGCEVAFISPQPEKNSAKLANKFGLNLHFLSDKNNVAAKKLGIDMKNGLPLGMEVLGYDSDTVLPTVLIINAEGNIIYSDLTNNYRIRPEPKDFLNVLQAQ